MHLRQACRCCSRAGRACPCPCARLACARACNTGLCGPVQDMCVVLVRRVPEPKARGGSRRGGPRAARTPVGLKRRGARALDHVQAAGAADGRQRRHGAQVEVAQRRLPARGFPAQTEPGRCGQMLGAI